ncbi:MULTISPECIES: hypothetical protein [Amycolatopsis]|uniref:hypothetical protein n=1 Tax=Amycolatopsis TaxID=1813 RepID=UPI000B8A9D22|nr:MULTISPECIES: hypothetical protein [Amycolatopsis]OXM75146.1 hypothetical protein CF166_00700 [Amycolatopsis sp. KNN50.9b]
MDDNGRWLDRPRNVTRIVYGLVVLCALAFAAGLFSREHPHFGVEGWFGFHALYGFAGSVGLVLTAKWLRRFLRRDESYYERPDGTADDE